MNRKERRRTQRSINGIVNKTSTGLDSLESRLSACKLAGDTSSAAKLERRIAKKKETLKEVLSYINNLNSK